MLPRREGSSSPARRSRRFEFWFSILLMEFQLKQGLSRWRVSDIKRPFTHQSVRQNSIVSILTFLKYKMNFLCLILLFAMCESARLPESRGLHRAQRDLIGYNRLGNNVYNWYDGKVRHARMVQKNQQTGAVVRNIVRKSQNIAPESETFQQMISSPNVSADTKRMLRGFLQMSAMYRYVEV